GAQNLHAFVGINGPYEFDSNGNGKIDDGDQPNVNAMGLSLSGVDFALAMLKINPVSATDQRNWFALSAHADDVRLVGIDNLTAQISKLIVEINQGGGRNNAIANDTVVNFSVLPTGGLQVPTSNTDHMVIKFDS